LLLIGLAPWVITLLYSAEFAPAATLLQWQTVGNVFKLASWVLGLAFVAAARGKIFLLVQINFNVLFLLMLWPSLGAFGLVATGPSFMVAYILHFALLNILAYTLLGFRWQTLSLQLLGTHAVLAFTLLVLANIAPLVGAGASIALALLTGLVGLRVVLNKVGPGGRLVAHFARFYSLIGWPLRETQ
jgi:O-antigen/teichoic acid export membrane protein